jgi:hypothetical protein
MPDGEIRGWGVHMARILSFRSMLHLWIKTGLQPSRGVSILALCKAEFGVKGNKHKVLALIEDFIENECGHPLDDRRYTARS